VRGDEPDLLLVRPDHPADQQIVRAGGVQPLAELRQQLVDVGTQHVTQVKGPGQHPSGEQLGLDMRPTPRPRVSFPVK
jgi:hypothetical protein